MIGAWAWRDGKVTPVADADVAAALAARADGGFLWLHVEPDSAEDESISRLPIQLPPTVERALVAAETRPRCEGVGDGVLVNLRAPSLEPVVRGAGDPLVSLRLWGERGLLLSVGLRPSTILPEIEERFRAGELHDPGDVIIAIAVATAEAVDGEVAAIGDAVDDLESSIDPATPFSVRRRVTSLRSKAISYRRFVVPQRLALERLAAIPLPWLDEGERAAVREAADRFARMGEELESARERAAVLHEEMTDLRSEKMDARSLQIAIVATIFLPLTFITGLLGMNVGGIPFAQEAWAFWGVVGFCVMVAAGVSLWFAFRRWGSR